MPPWVVGREPRYVLGASQTNVDFSPAPKPTLRIDQGMRFRCVSESAEPPSAGVRTKAICVPSGDHRGRKSLAKTGSIQLTFVLPISKYPTKE